MIGKRVAQYEITELIGKGGMGEVYRARDTRLDRDVAVKVLPAHHLENAEARARFQREAKAVAALSHPNILAIHDFGEHAGMTYAVTELLEGQTLRDRLQAGPVPLREALDLAAQMAEGLAAAHEKGIIHRDIKPGNVFLTPDGRVKILDFGLAKTSVMHDSQTQTLAVADDTAPGTVLGTVRYMSPEQVRAEPLDHRSDIFSLGIVLWEMLKGSAPFDGDSAVPIMNAILTSDPTDLSTSDTSVPAVPDAVERILRRCLEKSPARRFQSAHDLAFALRNASDASNRSLSGVDTAAVQAAGAPASGEQGARLRPWLVAAALFLLGGAAGAFVVDRFGSTEILEPIKVVSITHSGNDAEPSASPDGSMIAFVSERDGRQRVWLRQLKGGIEAPLTEGSGFNPKFSPDGTNVLFLRIGDEGSSAYRVSVVGGAERKILDNVTDAGWSPTGDRVAYVRAMGDAVTPGSLVGIHDIQTGQDVELARFDGRFLFGLGWSPDGAWLTASSSQVTQNTTDNTIVMIDAATGEVRRLVTKANKVSGPTWTPDSRSLIYAESTSLLGDISSSLGRVLILDPFTGNEGPLFWVQSVWGGSGDFVRFDFIDDDTMVFDEILWRESLTEVSMQGDAPYAGGTRLTHGNARDRQPAYAPDGDRIVFSSNRSGNLDIWTLNVRTGELRQITDDAADDWDPAFSVDGRSILWSSNRGGHLEIWMAGAEGGSARQVSQDGVDAENPTQTRDGAWIVYGSGNPEKPGIWKIRTEGSDATHVTPGAFLLPEVSPDGRYVVFVGNDPETNHAIIQVSDLETLEVAFTTSVPFTGFQRQISLGRARWMPDGESLVFVAVGESGRTSLFVQDFDPGQDTIASRRLLIVEDPDRDLESFGIAPDGTRITVAHVDHFRSLKIAEGIAKRR